MSRMRIPTFMSALFCVVSIPALAQAQDPNIISDFRIDIPTPPIQRAEPKETVVRKRETTTTVLESEKPKKEMVHELNTLSTEKEKQAVVSALQHLSPEFAVQPLYTDDSGNKLSLQSLTAAHDFNRLNFDAYPAFIVAGLLESARPGASKIKSYRTTDKYVDKTVIKPAKITVSANVTTYYKYDSNITSKKTDPIHDRYLSVVPAVSIAVPLPSTHGEFGFAFGITEQRYDQNPLRDFDAMTGTVQYVETLSKKQLDPKSKTAQADTFTMGMVAKARYKPGFSGPGTKFYSPSIEWKRKDIPIGDRLCGKKAGQMYNCFTVDIALGSDTNWVGSDGTAKNGEASLGGAISWNILGPELYWKTSASLIEGLYWEYPGGRNDLNYAVKSLLQWKPSDSVSLAASVEYYQQLSSQETVDFNKYVLFPRVVATANF